MTARDFCYWLQGFFELSDRPGGQNTPMTSDQVARIQAHLALVFKHEIDPSIDKKDPLLKKALDDIHGTGFPGAGPRIRC